MDLLCTEEFVTEGESERQECSSSPFFRDHSDPSSSSSCSCSSSSPSSVSDYDGHQRSKTNGLAGLCEKHQCNAHRSSESSEDTVVSVDVNVELVAALSEEHANSNGNTATVTYIHQRSDSPPQPPQPKYTTYSGNVYVSRPHDCVSTATKDPTFLTDRCLKNALKAEKKKPCPSGTYFLTVQKDITPTMRTIVAEWMMEVCAEEKCQEEVVLLALNYMDRFLSAKSVRKTHLQTLGAACLLLASKLREPSCRALSAELLVFYTANSIYKSDLIKWELIVLSLLGWDLSTVTPLDFLELLLIRLPIRSALCIDLSMDKVRQHAQAFITLAAKDHYFSVFAASTVAAASIAASLNGLNWHLRTGSCLRNLLNILRDLTGVKQDDIHECMMKMESVFEEQSRKLKPYLQQQQQQQQQQQNQQQLYHNYNHHHHHHRHHSSIGHSSSNSNNSSNNNSNINNGNGNVNHQLQASAPTSHITRPDLTQTCKMQANAQKDVQDIKY